MIIKDFYFFIYDSVSFFRKKRKKRKQWLRRQLSQDIMHSEKSVLCNSGSIKGHSGRLVRAEEGEIPPRAIWRRHSSRGRRRRPSRGCTGVCLVTGHRRSFFGVHLSSFLGVFYFHLSQGWYHQIRWMGSLSSLTIY